MNIKKTINTLANNFQQLSLLFISLNLLAFSGVAQSIPVFTQSPLNDGDGPASFFVEQSADNFSLTADTEITGIQWWGSFFDDTISNDVFDIRFFNDNTGLPANSAFETFSPVVSRSASGLFDLFGGEVFLFEASLTPFNLLANTDYYVSIVHPDDALDDEFFWLQSDTTGSNFTRDTTLSNTWVSGQVVFGNLAFSLQGNQAVVATVPEPNSIVLFSLALMALTRFHRPINS